MVNNADRKAGHVLADKNGRVFGIDHGVCFHEEPKLRTVLWGWVDTPIPPKLLRDLTELGTKLGSFDAQIDPFLSEIESGKLRDRIAELVHTQVFPRPSAQWPSIPWPVF